MEGKNYLGVCLEGLKTTRLTAEMLYRSVIFSVVY
jgi:hypothetical protein